MGAKVMIWIGNNGYGRKPYYLSLPHQTTFGKQRANEANYKTVERVLVDIDDIELVLNWKEEEDG